ncbi:MAG: hypothetical protein RJB66_554 [Pseudomonadota bacterium]|jgi:environmental stress-induced protein Ves
MQQLLKASNYRKMPWKNKKGVTSEIYIHPQESNLENLNFEFRLSSAPIIEDTVFSKFSGFERILIPIRGSGFMLNGHIYEKFEAAHFAGDADTHCDLIEGEVLDLGLIYDPQFMQAQVKLINFEKSLKITTSKDSIFLVYILTGSARIGDQEGQTNDCWVVSQSESIHFESSKKAMLAFFTLNPKTN